MSTQQAFDDWYRSLPDGDPWEMASPGVQYRLRRTVEALERFVPAGFEGAFVELGPFRGEFTSVLVRAFPRASVLAYEISAVAAEQWRKIFANNPRARVEIASLRSIKKENLPAFSAPPVVLALEVLYYLPSEERPAAIQGLAEKFPDSFLVISAPVTGGKYFRESDLVGWLGAEGFRRSYAECINLRTRAYGLQKPLLWLCSRLPFLRDRLANQVLWVFSPCRKSGGAP